MNKNTERRLKRVGIHVPFIDQLLRDGHKFNWGSLVTVESEIPKDAQLVRIFSDETSDTVYFVYEHETFDRVQLGEIIPLAEPPSARMDRIEPLLGEVLRGFGIEAWQRDEITNKLLKSFLDGNA